MISRIGTDTYTRMDSYGLSQVVRSEFTKLRSLRSTLWMVLIAIIGSMVVTVLASRSDIHHRASWYQGFDPTNQSLTGLAVALLSIGILGALSVTGEYGSATMRSTLSAAPRRSSLIAGKVIVTGAIALVVGEILTFACFAVGQAILSGGGAPSASLGQPGVLRALTLSGIFLALIGLLGFGLGVVIRHTAGAVAAFVGATLLLPAILSRMPGDLTRYTPVGILANSVSAVRPPGGQLSPSMGITMMLLYSAAILGAGVSLFARRDA
jgi:ABC-type transport system involved in multi-copper enzyme maturation permease subunit